MDRFVLRIEGTGPGPSPEGVLRVAGMIHARPQNSVEKVSLRVGGANAQELAPDLGDVREMAARFAEMQVQLDQQLEEMAERMAADMEKLTNSEEVVDLTPRESEVVSPTVKNKKGKKGKEN